MKHHMSRTRLAATACAAFSLFSASQLYAQETLLKTLGTSACSVDEADWKTNWIALPGHLTKLPTPIGPLYDDTKNMVYVFPANGPEFYKNADGKPTNCDFFRWGNQMFYWLTSTVTDEAKDNAVSKDLNTDPQYVFGSEFFYRFDPETGQLKRQNESFGSALVRNRKTDTSSSAPVTDSVDQAGSEQVLFVQTDKKTPPTISDTYNSMVYYEVMTNRTFGFITVRNQKFIADYSQCKNSKKATCELPDPAVTKFPSSQKEVCSTLDWAKKEGYINTNLISEGFLTAVCPSSDKSSNKATIPNDDIGDLNTNQIVSLIEPLADYLSMAVELKTAWVDVNAVSDPSKYILKQGIVPVYELDEKEAILKQTGTEQKTLALVGMHIVGSVENHPEMVWATIEHLDNAPDVATYYVDPVTGKTEKSTSELELASLKSYLLFAQNSDDVALNTSGAQQDPNSTEQIIPVPASSSPTPTPFWKPANVVRANPWGSVPIPKNAETTTQLVTANASARERLSSTYVGELENVIDPRLNYVVTGVSWGLEKNVIPGKQKVIPGGKSLTEIISGEITGTTAMSNMTLETFTQFVKQGAYSSQFTDFPQSDVRGWAENGCFACHNGHSYNDVVPADIDLRISHTYGSVTGIPAPKH